MNPQKKFWKWRNQADGEPEARVLELYGTIASESWFDDDVTPQMFKDELFADDGDVVIYLNSPGSSIRPMWRYRRKWASPNWPLR